MHFFDTYDLLSDGLVTLRLTEKNSGSRKTALSDLRHFQHSLPQNHWAAGCGAGRGRGYPGKLLFLAARDGEILRILPCIISL